MSQNHDLAASEVASNCTRCLPLLPQVRPRSRDTWLVSQTGHVAAGACECAEQVAGICGMVEELHCWRSYLDQGRIRTWCWCLMVLSLMVILNSFWADLSLVIIMILVFSVLTENLFQCRWSRQHIVQPSPYWAPLVNIKEILICHFISNIFVQMYFIKKYPRASDNSKSVMWSKSSHVIPS